MVNLRSWIKWIVAAVLIGAFVLPTALAAEEEKDPQVEPADEMAATARRNPPVWIEPRHARVQRLAAARRFWRNPWAETRRQALLAHNDAMRRGLWQRRAWSDGWFDRHLFW